MIFNRYFLYVLCLMSAVQTQASVGETEGKSGGINLEVQSAFRLQSQVPNQGAMALLLAGDAVGETSQAQVDDLVFGFPADKIKLDNLYMRDGKEHAYVVELSS
jgi:hypothetical protein